MSEGNVFFVCDMLLAQVMNASDGRLTKTGADLLAGKITEIYAKYGIERKVDIMESKREAEKTEGIKHSDSVTTYSLDIHEYDRDKTAPATLIFDLVSQVSIALWPKVHIPRTLISVNDLMREMGLKHILVFDGDNLLWC